MLLVFHRWISYFYEKRHFLFRSDCALLTLRGKTNVINMCNLDPHRALVRILRISLALWCGVVLRCEAVNVTSTLQPYRPSPLVPSPTVQGGGLEGGGVGAKEGGGGAQKGSCPSFCSCQPLITTCRGTEIKSMAQLNLNSNTQHL